MQAFDPTKNQEYQESSSGYGRFLEKSFEEAKANRRLTSNANAALNYGCECLILGLYKPGKNLIEMCRKWITEAIEVEEKPNMYFQYGTEASRHYNLAMCNWLLDGLHDTKNVQQYMNYQDRYLGAMKPDPGEIDLSISTYLNAKAYDQVLKLFASCSKLKVPEKISGIHNEAQMCYVICQQRLKQEYSEEEVHKVLEKFLFHHVDTQWLAKGHYDRTAQWMKIAHWQPHADPIKAILRCYDYLPGRTPPIHP